MKRKSGCQRFLYDHHPQRPARCDQRHEATTFLPHSPTDLIRGGAFTTGRATSIPLCGIASWGVHSSERFARGYVFRGCTTTGSECAHVPVVVRTEDEVMIIAIAPQSVGWRPGLRASKRVSATRIVRMCSVVGYPQSGYPPLSNSRWLPTYSLRFGARIRAQDAGWGVNMDAGSPATLSRCASPSGQSCVRRAVAWRTCRRGPARPR